MGPELGLLLQAEQGLRFESHEVYLFASSTDSAEEAVFYVNRITPEEGDENTALGFALIGRGHEVVRRNNIFMGAESISQERVLTLAHEIAHVLMHSVLRGI